MTLKDDNVPVTKQQAKVEAHAKMTEAEEKFDRTRKMIGFFLGPILGLIIYFLPIQGLSWEAHALLAIVAFVATWWICEPIPIPATSMLGPVLAALIGIVPIKVALAPFANPLIFLFLGSFLIATAMMTHGVDKRVAYGILSMNWVGSSPARIMLALGLVTALLSGWVSNTATTAMMYPIALGLIMSIKDMHSAQGKEIDVTKYKYATGLMLAAGYSASVGGVLTPVGTPPNIIVMGFLDKMAHIQINFFQWMIWGSIAMVAYFIVMYVVLLKMFPSDVKHIEGAQDFIKAKRKELGPWTRGQINAVIAFLVAVTLWILPGFMAMFLGPHDPVLKTYHKHFAEASVAMIAGLLLFMLPVDWKKREFTLTWKQANKGIEWGTLMLFGGGLSLGSMMFSTKLSTWIGTNVVTLTGANTLVSMVAVFAVLALLMSELTSHTASTNMIAPLGITAAMAAGVDPVPVAVAIALASSLGFMLPVSTPPNAIIYASGLIPITKMIRSGVIIDAIGIVFITIPLVIYVVSWARAF